jgi:hypothetical protein
MREKKNMHTECSIINPKNLEKYKIIATYITKKWPVTCFECENEKRMKKERML